MKTNLYEILNVSHTASADEIKAAFRSLARDFHPDRHANVCAADLEKIEDMFKRINHAYIVLSEPASRARYDEHGTDEPTTIQYRDRSYQLIRLAVSGDLADIFQAIEQGTGEAVAIKVSLDSQNNDLLVSEAEVLRKVRPADRKAEGKFARFYPRLRDSFRYKATGGIRQVNVFDWLDYWWTFEQVLSVHPALRIEHAAWMFNRLLGALSYAHIKHGVVHGAVLPPHVMAFASEREKDSRNHGVKLVDWCYSVKAGDKIRAISPAYRDFYPPEVFAKKPATFGTDIYMAAKTIIYVLGGDVTTNITPDHVPDYFENFLRGCMLANRAARPHHAAELHDEFKQHLRRHYGPKRYMHFGMNIKS